MTDRDRLTLEEVLAAFDEHLRRVRGVCPGTRRNYAKYVGEFLVEVFGDGGVEFTEVRASEVAAFIGGLSDRYRPRTVEHAATALRVFFRFLRAQGWCEDRLADAVPMVPHRPSGLVRHLDPRVLEQLIASLETASARDLRDRAIILTLARVGLRPGEVAQLRLEDIDWRNAVIRVRARKTGHGARLPLTSEVGEALADYLQHGRPEVDAREVFVLHWLRVGAPISTSIVGRAVQRAVDNAGIDAPARGGNLLRHSLATELLAGGASLPEIANVLGHSCLATTRIHAAVDIGRLRALPLHDFDQNRIWVAVVALAGELTAWMQMLVLHGHDARRWEPKRLRLRLFTIPATLAHTGRRVWLHLADKAPWANLAHLGITRLRELAVPG